MAAGRTYIDQFKPLSGEKYFQSIFVNPTAQVVGNEIKIEVLRDGIIHEDIDDEDDVVNHDLVAPLEPESDEFAQQVDLDQPASPGRAGSAPISQHAPPLSLDTVDPSETAAVEAHESDKLASERAEVTEATEPTHQA